MFIFSSIVFKHFQLMINNHEVFLWLWLLCGSKSYSKTLQMLFLNMLYWPMGPAVLKEGMICNYTT